MTTFRPAIADDLAQLDIRPEQPFAVAGRDQMVEHFERLGDAWTFSEDGEPFMVAGLIQAWPGRGIAWAVVGAHRTWGGMMRAGAELMNLMEWELSHRFHRIEAYADCFPLDWWVACDWFLQRLGFHREGVLSRYTQDGRDQCIYARVRHDG